MLIKRNDYIDQNLVILSDVHVLLPMLLLRSRIYGKEIGRIYLVYVDILPGVIASVLSMFLIDIAIGVIFSTMPYPEQLKVRITLVIVVIVIIALKEKLTPCF